MGIKRTPEGLQWPIDRKIEHDLCNWSEHKKRRAKQHGAFCLENKTKSVYQALQGDGFNLEKKG
ncbi:hypothetical protein [Lactiplantibacillus plantarum]|uniref:hypothetical protein n=1 Tax=Lactiplantibacillus plantarum TaxID=1590 RepID=UPI002653BD82|nr:hypothetical protein [Lactiplantibacillus plantarum]MDN7014446.1 hypothetical protein [Lactiplantibacillus plantarum]MDN7048033.1 hypothetical protein [Lactiplantibacillus plantarum]MDN7051116.1 hypothetical protein [Lactiplantibacillus plantarum]MDN7054119.1 hypothetical protein [Lactiplantibacillus plantarum]MDN7057193.1 hypothetical protein [Lactiplantibacillus plantarum]